MVAKIIYMINSEDREVAALGAKLALQENEEEAIELEGLNWYFDFYKDNNGDFYLFRIIKATLYTLDKNTTNGFIEIMDIDRLNAIMMRNMYLVEIPKILEYDENTGRYRENVEI